MAKKNVSKADPLSAPEVTGGPPSSSGIDWVAETARSETLPSEELDIPGAEKEDLREMLGEQVLTNATSGDDAAEEMHEQLVPEEFGGPFVETQAKVEFAKEPDPSNPEDAEAEPLPLATSETPEPPFD